MSHRIIEPAVSAAIGYLMVVVLLLGGCSDDSGPVKDGLERGRASQRAASGEALYLRFCASCHQADGQGTPGVSPPLDGTDWVTGDEVRLVRVILHGLTGPIEVNGVQYVGAMPPWRALMDDDVASIATYVRNSWTNEASSISAEDVARVRTMDESRRRPWTAEELER